MSHMPIDLNLLTSQNVTLLLFFDFRLMNSDASVSTVKPCFPLFISEKNSSKRIVLCNEASFGAACMAVHIWLDSA